MIRVVLPAHLRTLARVDGEVKLEVAGPVTRAAVWMRAWVRVWLWKSKRPEWDRESISSQERNAPSPCSRPRIASGDWRRVSTSSHVGGSGPGREGTRPGTRKTMPFMP